MLRLFPACSRQSSLPAPHQTGPAFRRKKKRGARICASEEQAAFFQRMGTQQELRLLFDHMIGVHFFMKDHEGRFMAYGLSEHQCLRLGAHESIIGRTDFDIYPANVAARVRADDRKVMESDRPLLNIVELLVNPALQTIDWYVTNKRPLHDSAGKVIGVMGTAQAYEVRRRLLLSGTKLDEGVEYARQHATENCSVEDLARVACMSTRQLSRKFVEVLGIAPREFLLHTRMKEACGALGAGKRQRNGNRRAVWLLRP